MYDRHTHNPHENEHKSGEYMYVVDDIFVAPGKNHIDHETKKDVLSILWSLKDMIIVQ